MKEHIVDMILDGTYQTFKEGETKIDTLLDECGGSPGLGGNRKLLIDDEDEKCSESELKEETKYQSYFRSKMAEFGIKSPNELSSEKKSEFFAAIKKGWTKTT